MPTETSKSPHPKELSYWIQRSDLTYAPHSGEITLEKAQSLLRDFDWKAELVYQRKLEDAKKDSCFPTIGFTGLAGFLRVQPEYGGTVACYVWDTDGQLCWGCGGLEREEQSRILDLFYRDDLSFVRDWLEFEVETYTDEQGHQRTRAKPADNDPWFRAVWLAKTKQSRARRGQPAELTDEERNLSEKDALELHLREARAEEEERHRAATIKRTRSSRNWYLIISAGGTLVAAFLYSGVLHHSLSDRVLTDLWAVSLFAMLGGPVLAGLQHLELRVLLLGTDRARKQLQFAATFCGTVMFLAFAVVIAALLAFWLVFLASWLLPSLGNVVAGPHNERGFLRLGGVLLAIMGLTTAALFARRRASNPTEPRLISIHQAATITMGSFGAPAVAPFILMLPVFAATFSLMVLGFTGAGEWVNSNFALLTVLMLPLMTIFALIAYLYGRWAARESESKTATLLSAGMRVVAIFFFGSMGVFMLFFVAFVLKANGLLG
jgi:hypothetical protein